MSEETRSKFILRFAAAALFIYLMVLFHISVDDYHSINEYSFFILITAVVVLFIPFFEKISLLKFFELERKVKSTKEEVSSLRDEVRFNMTNISNSISTISQSSVNTQIMNIPAPGRVQEEMDILEEKGSLSLQKMKRRVIEEIDLKGEEDIMSLAKVRIKIEHMIRLILKEKKRSDKERKSIKKMTYGKLYRIFLRENEQFGYLRNSFFYIGEIANAAIHGRHFSEDNAKEAIELGSNVIAILREHRSEIK